MNPHDQFPALLNGVLAGSPLSAESAEAVMRDIMAGLLTTAQIAAIAVALRAKGETEEEFQERRAALLAKSKTGKTTASRKMAEPDEEFQERLAEKYTDPAMLHREMLYLSRDRFDILRSELWELTQAFLDARRRGVFYQNTGFCFNYHRPCAYFALCRSNGNPNVIENFYQRVAPNEELRVLPETTTETTF